MVADFTQLLLDKSPSYSRRGHILSLREGAEATKDGTFEWKAQDLFIWQINLGVIQGPTRETGWAKASGAICNLDECPYVVWLVGYGAEDAAAAIDSEGCTG